MTYRVSNCGGGLSWNSKEMAQMKQTALLDKSFTILSGSCTPLSAPASFSSHSYRERCSA